MVSRLPQGSRRHGGGIEPKQTLGARLWADCNTPT